MLGSLGTYYDRTGTNMVGLHDRTRILKGFPRTFHPLGANLGLSIASRMAPKKKSGGGNPRDQYFTAIKQQKLDTLRWCLRHGGVTHRSEDEEGHTGLMVAAAGGFSDSLGKLIEQVLKIGPPEDMDDVDEDGRTPLMMAAYNGAAAHHPWLAPSPCAGLAWPGLDKTSSLASLPTRRQA